MEELVFVCVYCGYTTFMKFKEAPHGALHSERNLNLNQVKPVKAHQRTGEGSGIGKQTQWTPSDHHVAHSLIHVVH